MVVVVALVETCVVDVLLRLEVLVVEYNFFVTLVLVLGVGLFFITFITWFLLRMCMNRSLDILSFSSSAPEF